MAGQKNLWLNAMRGIACLIVLFAHLGAISTNYGMYFNGCGKIGVWLFMVLSGFWFMYPLCRNRKSLTGRSLGKFYLKKLLRIFVIYFVTLLLAWGIGFLADFQTVVRHLFLIEGRGHFWYMPVIVKFFMVAPIFWYFRNICKKDIWFVVVLIIFGSLFTILFPYTDYPENSAQLRWYLPVFILGVILGVIFCRLEESGYSGYVTDILTIPVAGTMLLLTPWFRERLWNIAPSSYLQNKYLLLGTLWCLVILAVLCGRFWKTVLSRYRLLQWIGDISFPMYLVHYPIMMEVNNFDLTWGMKAMIVILTSGALACMMHWLIEKPLGEIGKLVDN